jgi:hypothetical protein
VIRKTDAERPERVLVSLPPDVMEFLDHEAERNCASRNSEIVRSIRKRMGTERPAT